MPNMPDQSLIFKYFPHLTNRQQEQIIALFELYKEWNQAINVVSRKDFDSQFYEQHVLHSLAIAKVAQFGANTQVLDAGTGGGFPGIPLAILFPEAQFHLVDSIGKKIKVVKAVADALELNNVQAQQARVETLKVGAYHFVVSRAVTRMEPFYHWVKDKFKSSPPLGQPLKNGILYLKGGELSEELAPIMKPIRQYELNQFFEEKWFDTKKVVYVKMG